MGRRRRRRPEDNQNNGHPTYVDDEGKVVHVRKIGTGDEGVLYTMQLSSKKPRPKSKAPKASCFSWLSCSKNKSQVIKGPETNTLFAERSDRGQTSQFTVKKKRKYKYHILNWFDSHGLNFSLCNLTTHHDVDTHLYRPSNYLYLYIDWTFTASFTAVFITFFLYYFCITVLFGMLLMVVGTAQPECIVSGGEHFGSNPYTNFHDAYALSWTTFTTVGYGNTYTSTGNDLIAKDGTTKAHECLWVVFICNAEAFFGLLYAGMCASILFGKVNRVQSHAKLIFANAVCLQYEEIKEQEDEFPDDVSEQSTGKQFVKKFHKKWTTSSNNLNALFRSASRDEIDNSKRFTRSKSQDSDDKKVGRTPTTKLFRSSSQDDDDKFLHGSIKDGMKVSVTAPDSPLPPPFIPMKSPKLSGYSPIRAGHDKETPATSVDSELKTIPPIEQTPSKVEKFVDQFHGCPVLKFQVVNEMCNREGSELVDAIMKVVGIKFKVEDEITTNAQYVRVNLVDFEHPFLSRVWHGVHVLNADSPLLTDKSRREIKENNGSWPTEWFEQPGTIREHLEFNDLVVTVSGISNVSALTVHAYKRYKIGDVLIGFNFAPVVFRDIATGLFDVDLTLCHDVREQQGGGSENLDSQSSRNHDRPQSTIRVTKSRDSDFFSAIESQVFASSGSGDALVNNVHPLMRNSVGSGDALDKNVHPLMGSDAV